jgi:hypothetical protein
VAKKRKFRQKVQIAEIQVNLLLIAKDTSKMQQQIQVHMEQKRLKKKAKEKSKTKVDPLSTKNPLKTPEDQVGLISH